MSDQLYATRLRWDGRRGVAKLHGRTAPLTAAPILGSHAPHAIDYVPEVRICEIQPRPCDPRRDMTPAEIEDADRWLSKAFEQPV